MVAEQAIDLYLDNVLMQYIAGRYLALWQRLSIMTLDQMVTAYQMYIRG
jgi:hypothetical protein